MLIEALKAVYDIDGKEVTVSGGKLWYKTGSDTIFSFIDKLAFVDKAKKWIISNPDYAIMITLASVGSTFALYKKGKLYYDAAYKDEFNAFAEMVNYIDKS